MGNKFKSWIGNEIPRKEFSGLHKIWILIMEFIILWFFGIVAFCYALTLTDTFSAIIIWIGGGMCFSALYMIKYIFTSHNK